MFDYAGAHIWAPGLRHYLPRNRIFFFRKRENLGRSDDAKRRKKGGWANVLTKVIFVLK